MTKKEKKEEKKEKGRCDSIKKKSYNSRHVSKKGRDEGDVNSTKKEHRYEYEYEYGREVGGGENERDVLFVGERGEVGKLEMLEGRAGA